MITTLILLSAAICLLVIFLPKLTSVAVGSQTFGGQTFYFLATEKFDDRTKALLGAQSAVDRGGAGYIYNDGSYHIVAAVYDKESDAKALTAVNENSYYFSLTVHKTDMTESETKLIAFITGEWFTAVSAAASELSRGNITESQAECAVLSVCLKAISLAENVSPMLSNAVTAACDYSCPLSISVLAYIRYVQVDTVVSVVRALSV